MFDGRSCCHWTARVLCVICHIKRQEFVCLQCEYNKVVIKIPIEYYLKDRHLIYQANDLKDDLLEKIFKMLWMSRVLGNRH